MTDGNTHTPIPLARADSARGTAILTGAFMDDPLYGVIFPDMDDRRRSLDLLWRAVISYTTVYGKVYTTRMAEGVACWLTPGNTDVTVRRHIRTGFGLQRAVMRFEPEARNRLMGIISLIDAMHRETMHRPHWYLWALGVSPDRRNRGIGGALLRPALIDADLSGAPCYLETQTERNAGFYEKHGFRVVREEEPDIPGLHLWAMVREPR